MAFLLESRPARFYLGVRFSKLQCANRRAQREWLVKSIVRANAGNHLDYTHNIYRQTSSLGESSIWNPVNPLSFGLPEIQ